MALTDAHINLAIANTVTFGDTDVLPRPFELKAIEERAVEIAALVSNMYKEFAKHQERIPIEHHFGLSASGYLGLRKVSQLHPLWNLFFLACVISCAKDIEKHRIPISENAVFSYRYRPKKKDGKLFDSPAGWKAFNDRSSELSNSHAYVVTTDIADFYSRVYHHRIENALNQCTRDSTTVKIIVRILSALSGNVSYGLPVGGNAARILSEALLIRTDKLLKVKGIRFCRFVDDYRIFSDTKEDAYRALTSLADGLMVNEGLALNRSKTRILTGAEFRATTVFIDDRQDQSDSETESELRDFVSIRIKYDPYSPTADEDYENLKSEIGKFDIVGLLTRELAKSRVDEFVARRLLHSIRFLSDAAKNQAATTLSENIETLYPIFPLTSVVLARLLNEIDDEPRRSVFSAYRDLVATDSHTLMVQANLHYAIRILANDPDDLSEQYLETLFQSTQSPIIRRDIILAMVQRKADYWISERIRFYATSSAPERRALIWASYMLKDEGKHWRDRAKSGFDDFEEIIRNWATHSDHERTLL